MVVLLHTKHPHLYHKVVDSFACSGMKFPKSFEASGQLYGEYMHGLPVPSPPGKISRALVTHLRDLIELSHFPIRFSPQMMLHDTAFYKPAMDDPAIRHLKPFVVFTIDVPSRFLETLMLTLREYIKAKFYDDYYRFKNLNYGVFHFLLPEYMYL